LRRELVDWFTATPGEKAGYFYYDRKCGGLIGMNSSFFTYNYTDHHFHYGHFVYAAAILSLYDSSFAEDYGEMVELLIQDYNSPDREHPMFPWMRMMDPYEGHSWANGLGGWGEGLNDAGNDHESSSEAMHAWQAIFFWGMVTGNDRLRDHGAWGYVTEASAINQYYFDVDNDIYPNDTGFEHEFVSLLLGGKASYPGYFHFSEYTFGIQYLPITPSSLYLGYNPRHARRQYKNFLRENGGVEDQEGWYDTLWMYQALFDPEAVLAKYDESVTLDQDGNSFANVYRWIHFFAGVGQVDVSVMAPWPYVSAFRKGDEVTVMAYNPGRAEVEVPFRVRASGEPLTTLTVAPGAIATETVTTRKAEP
jgi:endoglucanase Acf2